MSSDSSLLIERINKYRDAIEGVEIKNYKKHVATRRMSLIALVGFFISFFVVIINNFYSNNIIFDECLLIKTLGINLITTSFLSMFIVIMMPFFLYFSVFYFYKDKSNNSGVKHKIIFCIFLFFIVLIVIFCASSLFFMAMSTAGVTLFVLYYGSNRYFGYTRSWVRNRAVRFHLEKMMSEYELNILDKAPFMVEIEEQALKKKFYALVEKNIEQQQKDIVGDHFSVGDATLSWIKGLKK